MPLNVYKNKGETPLECLKRLRKERPEYERAILSYAGRLDPLASGVMLVLVGEENKSRKDFLKLNKQYEVDVLCGISTDTGDVLGLVREVLENKANISENDLIKFVGERDQKFPAYSSVNISRRQRNSDVRVDTKKIKIESVELLDKSVLPGEKLMDYIEKSISRVNGDFRQKEVLESWKNNEDIARGNWPVARIRVCCSSGTYMRTLAEDIGHSFAVPALALEIKRTKVGIFTIQDSIR